MQQVVDGGTIVVDAERTFGTFASELTMVGGLVLGAISTEEHPFQTVASLHLGVIGTRLRRLVRLLEGDQSTTKKTISRPIARSQSLRVAGLVGRRFVSSAGRGVRLLARRQLCQSLRRRR